MPRYPVQSTARPDREDRKQPPSAREKLDRALRFVRRAARFYPFALALLIVGAAGTLVFDLARPRAYLSETILEYREGIRVAGMVGEPSGDPVGSMGARLKELLLYRSRLAGIIKALKLYPTRKEVDAEEEMRRHIALRVSGSSFAISFVDGRPETAQAVVTRLAAGLIEDSRTVRSEQATRTRNFLDLESARNDAVLEGLEATAAAFIVDHPEFRNSGLLASSLAPDASASDPIVEDRGRDDGGAYVALQVEAAQVGPLASLQAARVARLRTAESNEQTASRDLRDKLAHFTEHHPDVIAARHAHEEAKVLLDRAAAEVGAGAPSAYGERLAAVSRIGGHAGPAPRHKVQRTGSAEGRRLVGLRGQWSQLSREVAEARERRAQLAPRLFTWSLIVSSSDTHLRVAEAAYLPRNPLPPGHAVVMAAGVLLALMLALGAAFAGAVLDDRLYDHGDLVRLGVGPIAESVAGVSCDDDDFSDSHDRAAIASLPPRLRQLVAAPGSPQSTSFQLLRFRLGAAGDPRIITVANASTGEASTQCAVNLAVAIAEQGHARAVIIDARARQQGPVVPDDDDQVESTRAVELLSNRTLGEPGDALARDPRTSTGRTTVPVRVITLPPCGRGEPIDGGAVAAGCRVLLESVCDYVVIDAPPVLDSQDANLIARAGDGILIAARAGHSSSRSVHSAAQQLAPSRVLGVALLSA